MLYNNHGEAVHLPKDKNAHYNHKLNEIQGEAMSNLLARANLREVLDTGHEGDAFFRLSERALLK